MTAAPRPPSPRFFVGTSGWNYASWRGDYYPTGLVHRRELEYIGGRLGALELNGSFYSLQRPASYARWAEEVAEGVMIAVKGPRYLTHMLRLRNARTGLANFLASGVLALGSHLGPILWQLPERFVFDPEVVGAFLRMLPRSTADAARLAAEHDAHVEGRAWLTTDADRPLVHVIEPRHPSFEDPAFRALIEQEGAAVAVSHAGEAWPVFEPTGAVVYVRLHGAPDVYASGYDDVALAKWAARLRAWSGGPTGPRDAYVFFDNDSRGFAPHDAERLQALLDPGREAP